MARYDRAEPPATSAVAPRDESGGGLRPADDLVKNLTAGWFSLLSSDDVAEQRFVHRLSRAVD